MGHPPATTPPGPLGGAPGAGHRTAIGLTLVAGLLTLLTLPAMFLLSLEAWSSSGCVYKVGIEIRVPWRLLQSSGGPVA